MAGCYAATVQAADWLARLLWGEAASPDLSDQVDGDLKMQVDFRQVYATLLEDWLSVESKDVLGGEFEKYPIFA